jgi:hypothetical protein
MAIGHHPNTKFLQGVIKLNKQGYVVTRNGIETSMDGSSPPAMSRQILPPGCYGCRFRLHGRLEPSAGWKRTSQKIVGTHNTPSIAYYVSAHGCGHGVRSCDIIRCLNRLYPQSAVHIVSNLPPDFLCSHLGSRRNPIRADRLMSGWFS